MGNYPNPARTNRTGTQVLRRTKLNPLSKTMNAFCILDLDLDNSRQEPEAITATCGCALRKSVEPTLEGRYCVRLSN